MNRRATYLAVALASGCAGALPAAAPEVARTKDEAETELARFMREAVNVPFSFAMLEHDGRRRPIRFQRAALVLQDAAHDLVDWQDPPADGAARDVFFEYARSLERQVDELEVATRHHDLDRTSDRLEAVRQTCNTCHRFFRPNADTAGDVVYDRLVVELLGAP